MTTYNKTSYLIASQLPQFVRSDHPKFIQFLEAYYQFMEQEGQLTDTTKNFLNNLNIDEADPKFQRLIFNNFLALLNKNIAADEKLVLKYAKDFYRAKGTEKAVKFLARILYDKEISIYYPKNDVLKVSDGKWYIDKSLKVTNIQVDNVANSIALQNFQNHKIIGASSNASATVETVDVYYDKGDFVVELHISGIVGQFQSNESIYTYYTEQGIDKYLTANIYSGIIYQTHITNPGTRYIKGTTVPLVANTGRNAEIKINKVSTGSLSAVGVTYGGAGFEVDDPILATTVYGGGGFGANAAVLTVDTSETYHPNTYSVVGSIIGLEANTVLGSIYPTLNGANANTVMANSYTYWVYGNCGPILSAVVIDGGQDYNLVPALSAQGNTLIRSLNMIGRVEVNHGGLNYSIGDYIEFKNPLGTYGTGAIAYVSNVASNGAITGVKIGQMPGHMPGGEGYDPNKPPIINVVSTSGAGANLYISSFLAGGDKLQGLTTSIGAIQELIILSGGTGYLTPPLLDFTGIGDGTANGYVDVAKVLYIYPGKYLNDDGKLSSYKFIEDRDYYQNYSYVVKISESISDYRNSLLQLTHPVGTKMWGEYDYTNDVIINQPILASQTELELFFIESYQINYKNARYSYINTPSNVKFTPVSFVTPFKANTTASSGSYSSNNSNITITLTNHGYTNNSYVYLSFYTNATSNIVDGIYTINYINNNTFRVNNPNTTNLVVGSCYIWNPLISINSNATYSIAAGSNVYINFDGTDLLEANGYYSIITSSNTYFTILDKFLPFAIETSGNLTVHTGYNYVSANQNGFAANDYVYVTFSSNITSNQTNAYYQVLSTPDANTFEILGKTPILSANASGQIYTQSLLLTSNNHMLGNTENAQIWFTSGNLANTPNGVYTASVVDGNTFTIRLNGNTYVTSNGSAVILSNNTYFYIYQVDHTYYEGGANVYVEFTSGDYNIVSNGIYTISDIIDPNRYSIFMNNINISKSDIITFYTPIQNKGNVTVDIVPPQPI